MHLPSLSKVVLCAALAALVLSPIISARAITVYLPAVRPGQFVQYSVLEDSCHSSILQVCQSFGSSLNDTSYAATEIVEASSSSPLVTLQLISIYKNGTGTHAGGLVNVATGESNITSFTRVTRDYFVLAGGLQAHDQIWNTPSAPKLNSTISEMVLGSSRNVNFLNYSLPGSYLSFSYLQSIHLAFDQTSGFLTYVNSSVTSSIPGLLELNVAIGMIDNNVWGNAHLPDFDISANPTSVNISGNALGNSTISLHRFYEFSATVKLSAMTSAISISCSLSPNSLPTGNSDASKLSCKGPPGTYTVTVVGNGGYSVHNASIAFTVTAGPTTAQPASSLPLPLVYSGIVVAAAVVILLALLFFRRKPKRAVIGSGDRSGPAVQAQFHACTKSDIGHI